MASAGCSEVEEWSNAGEVRYARSIDAGEVSSSGLAQVRVRVRVRERMGGGLGENERVREWSKGFRDL